MGLRSKDICNCEQALQYREALEQITEIYNNADAQDLGDCYERLCQINDLCEEALNHSDSD